MQYLYITLAILLARLIEWIVIALVRTLQQKRIARENLLRKILSQAEDGE